MNQWQTLFNYLINISTKINYSSMILAMNKLIFFLLNYYLIELKWWMNNKPACSFYYSINLLQLNDINNDFMAYPYRYHK